MCPCFNSSNAGLYNSLGRDPMYTLSVGGSGCTVQTDVNSSTYSLETGCIAMVG